MTEKEAIKELHDLRPRGGIIPQRRAEMIDVAIKALEEIQQYREIDTLEEIKDLLATISEAAGDTDEDEIKKGIIKGLVQLAKYREIGTVEQVKNQKHNLEVAYKIIGNYQGIGTVEECWEAMEKNYSADIRSKFRGYSKATPRRDKRRIKEIMKEFDYDDEYIKRISDEFCEGWGVAVDIISAFLSDEYWNIKGIAKC